MSNSAKIFIVAMGILLLFILETETNPARGRTLWRDYQEHWKVRPRGGGSTQTVLSPNLNFASQTPFTLQYSPNSFEFPGIPVIPSATPSSPVVKGIYLTSWMTGSNDFLKQITAFTARTEINAVVIDVKDDMGMISFLSSVPLARQISSDFRKYNPVKVLTLMKENHIFTIARIVVFKDPFLAKKRTDLAVQNRKGGLWRDKLGLYWVDPHSRTVWEYNVAIAKEAAELGFDEIQFDYIRFTSDGLIQDCLYPGADGRSKSDVIGGFLKYAYQELHPLGVKVSADVFGLTCTVKDDMGIGQVLEKVAPHVDVICPMVYPSHYPNGSYGIKDPDLLPYQTVFQSLSDAKKRLATLITDHQVILRPWLQDFSLRHRYNREQLMAQIKAVKDTGFQEYIFWNPSNKYDLQKYQSKEEAWLGQTVTPAPTLTPTPKPTLSPSPSPSPYFSPIPSSPKATKVPQEPEGSAGAGSGT